jgi:ABC-type uncharacterized transport system auxiliary subunit
MPSAAKVLILTASIAALAACHKSPQANAGANEDLSLEDNVASGQMPANTQVETLPADESSTTSSDELQKGEIKPTANEVGNGH